ncbi:MAG: hypothetical protein IJ655_05380 [Lachnospiraceae bacterium]|nr:hypothetical protein [Lachnospiraceae bacterium]
MQIDQMKIADFMKREDETKAGIYGAGGVILPDRDRANDIKSKSSGKADEVSASISMPKIPGQGEISNIYNRQSVGSDSVADKLENDMIHSQTATDLHNKMAVYSQTVSEEDFAKMQQDGFDPMNMEVHDIVTVADKIKIALAKGGHDISKMGGVSDAAIQEMAGGEVAAAALKRQLTDAVSARDLPQDTQMLQDGEQAVNMLEEIPAKLSDGAKVYLMDNNLEPTITNVYQATFATTSMEDRVVSLTDTEAVFEESGNNQLLSQLESVITDAGLELEDDRVRDAKWLMLNNLPVDSENILQAQELNNISVEIDRETAVEVVADVMARGENPLDMDLRQLKSMIQLQETRLAMTSKVSYQMTQAGIQIDTASIQDVIDELKNMEENSLRQLLAGQTEADTDVNVERYNTFTTELDELAAVPAPFVWKLNGFAEKTIDTITNEARAYISENRQNADFKAFQDRFETVMTAPRADMGDSIKKAFANVDDILDDLGFERSASNERAVRILAYNKIEINAENIGRVKATDAEVQKMYKALKPAAVLSIIREGKNPLDMKMADLADMAENFNENDGAENPEEKFAKFLWKLDRTQGISEVERQSFIGIYRLIHQVEAGDGAAVGALIAQGAEVTLRNLMTAVRSGKHTGREYEIDDDFGEISEFKRENLSIIQQVEMAFQYNALQEAGNIITPVAMAHFGNEDEYMEMTPDRFRDTLADALAENVEAAEIDRQQELEYTKAVREEISRALKSETEIYDMLQKFEIPTTPANLTAMQQMLADRNRMYRDLQKYSKDAEGKNMVSIGDLIDDLIEDYGEACKTPEEMAEAQRRLEKTAENVMKTMLIENDVREIDLRGMKMVMTQIREVGQMSTPTSESYNIPIMVEDKVGNLSLKIVHGTEDKGLVEVAFDTEPTGAVYGSFRYEAGEIIGDMDFAESRTRQNFAEHMGLFAQDMQEATGLPVSFTFAYDKNLSLDGFYNEADVDFPLRDRADEVDEQTAAVEEITTRQLYSIARSFIASASEILS